MTMDMNKLGKRDPIDRNAEKGADTEGTSPMDPPDAYEPPSSESVPYKQLHPFLQSLFDEHEVLTVQLATLEDTLQQIQTTGLTPEMGHTLRGFFEYFDVEFARHNRKEERQLFPLLRQRLIEHGEHSPGAERTTGVDILEEDHVKAIKQAAVACSFIGLAVRLPDERSGMMTLASGVEQGKDLIEHVRLHMFREENIIFGLAHKYITSAELDGFLTD